MTTYVTNIVNNLSVQNITLLFNDNKVIKLSTSSFLYKNSTFLQAFDLDEDNVINILCSSSYVIDNNKCLFDDKTDLSFMFTLPPYKFINLCKFLDIICYENKDNAFSEQFIIHIMDNTFEENLGFKPITFGSNKQNNIFDIKERISTIQYFMYNEIRSILNYLNKESIDIQIKCCTLQFYFLYINKFKEEVIKYNRIDIYESSKDKYEYYKYINKYNNQLTFNVKETKEYIKYNNNISFNLLNECNKSTTFNNIQNFIEQSANINLQNNRGNTILHIASKLNDNLNVIQYIIENGVKVNLQNNDGTTALHYASNNSNNLEIIQYLTENGANINLQDNDGNTALHNACSITNNLNVIQYLIENGANINLQDNDGNTALHNASNLYDNIDTIQYLLENNVDITLDNNDGKTILHNISSTNNNLQQIQYFIEQEYQYKKTRKCELSTIINSYDIDGKTALHYAVDNDNINNIQNLIDIGIDITIRDFFDMTALDYAIERDDEEIIDYFKSR